MPNNNFSDLWHVASKQFNSPNTVSPVWQAYQDEGGDFSPAMSLSLRVELYVMISAFILLAAFWQAQVVEGYIGDMIRAKYPSQKRKTIRY
jgi:cation-transporting ATPase 13A3/4/5